ncbi:MAG: DUF389 domain-containing protein [Candidatus Eremiobacteraeota bacterium]|nr:DUF389 domain-containing protein [Candidatus Eremiobacteraeota bacterium]
MAQRTELTRALYEDGNVTLNFSVLLLLSGAIATFGLLENNAAVIIGAMIIAPIVLPIQSLALGAVEGDLKLFRNGAVTVVLATVAAALLAGVFSLIAGIPEYGSEIIARSRPTLLDLGIAVAAGGVGAFARIRPAISATLAGTAVAVALMPPLSVIGIALAHGDTGLAYGSSLLYVTNLIGITLSSMVVYRLAGLGVVHNARRAIVTASILAIILGVPLGANFLLLLRESRVESTLKRELLTNTQTFHRVSLVKTTFNWLTTPPQVTLLVRSTTPITSGQVAALESFAQFKTGRRFRIVFEVTSVVDVRGDQSLVP